MSNKDDKLVYGCGIGCATQLSLLLVGLFFVGTVKNPGALWAEWAIGQTAIMTPIIFALQSRGKRESAKGLIISACLGILLSSYCGSITWTGR